jgi:hypothetical protein
VRKNSKNMPAQNLGLPGIPYLYAVNLLMVKKAAWILILAILAAACLDEPDCYLLNNQNIGISFKKLENSSADTIYLTGFGTVEPPLLFSDDTIISKLYLPLNYFQDETSFFFENEEGVDFLRLGYVSQAQFVSENCGEKFVLSSLRVLEHTFDSVRLITDIPTREPNTIHIEIFQ